MMKFISIYDGGMVMNRKISIILALFIILALAGAGSAATVSYNWSFPNDAQLWTSSSNPSSCTPDTCTVSWSGSDGNPKGSLYAIFTESSGSLTTVDTTWQSPNFNWNNGTPFSANIAFDVKIATYHPNSAPNPNNYSVFLIKPGGTEVLINKTTFNVADGWNHFSYNVGTNNFSQTGSYSLKLKANLSAIVQTVDNGVVSIGWDNPNITLQFPRNVSLTNISALSNTTIAGTNATYVLNLTNNGTAADTYTLAVTNANSASTALLNLSSSSQTLNVGQSLIFALNVTSTSTGTFYVNVTATSGNDPTNFSYVNTTTTVNAPTYIHAITPSSPQVGNSVTDTVNSTSSSLSNTMDFEWVRPNSSIAITNTGVSRNGVTHNYSNSFTVDMADNPNPWTIHITEKDNSLNTLGTSSTTFDVSAAPEFGKLGAVLPLFAIGILYMGLRKKIKK
jgi:hypothetical protein